MSNITIVGAGMMGSALAFPARENGHRVRLTGTHLDREIIAESKRTGKHPKFDKPFPAGVEYFYFEELAEALEGADMVICGVNSFGVDWFMQEVLPHIFEPFFTTKERGKGTGLGLAIVRQVMEEHKGTITIDTAPGRGTTMLLRFPTITPPEEDT